MGGRGANLGRGRGGGLGGLGFGGAAASAATQQPQQPQQQPPQQGATTPAGNTSLAQFQQMNDQQTVAYLNGLKNNVHMPPSAELPDSDTQRAFYDLGVNDKPRVVSDAQFKAMRGETLYRGVTENTDNNGTVMATAKSIANSTMYGEYSRIGGGVYGDGYYFSNSKSLANSYAGHKGSTAKSAVMRTKLDTSKVKAIDSNTLESRFYRESRAVQRAYQNMSETGNWAAGHLGVYALQKGYNAIKVPSRGITVVLDRGIMVMSDNVTASV